MAEKPDIHALALQFLQKHPKDKSGSLFVKMKRFFGKPGTIEAIDAAYTTCKLLDPDNKDVKVNYDQLIGQAIKSSGWGF